MKLATPVFLIAALYLAAAAITPASASDIFYDGFEGAPVQCQQGSATDLQDYTLQCAGTYKFHTGGADKQMGPSGYSFKFVWGNNTNQWPGGPFGTSQIFAFGVHKALAIPLPKPTPGHTIQIVEAQSWTAHPITFSVSTAPGLFGIGKADPAHGIICAGTNNPALKMTSNGNPTSQCVLDADHVYWFNIVGAKYSEAADAWINSFSPPNLQLATTIYSVN